MVHAETIWFFTQQCALDKEKTDLFCVYKRAGRGSFCVSASDILPSLYPARFVTKDDGYMVFYW